MISNETMQIVWNRSDGKCQNPECDNQGEELHHIFWKSEYNKADRDEDWNLCLLCKACHREGKLSIHARNLNQTINKKLNILLKNEAIKRHIKTETKKAPELIRFANQRKQERKKQLENFKNKHQGLSPSQVEYRKQKEIKKKYNLVFTFNCK